jgi:hypothetical protein
MDQPVAAHSLADALRKAAVERHLTSLETSPGGTTGT